MAQYIRSDDDQPKTIHPRHKWVYGWNRKKPLKCRVCGQPYPPAVPCKRVSQGGQE